MSTVFIYAKEDKIKVLDLEAALKVNQKLLSEGWEHTATIDACMWMEILYNDPIDIVAEVKQLSVTQIK